MFLVADIKDKDGKSITVLSIPEKKFKTGSKGYFTNSKIEFDGKRYQLQIQLVEIGSKEKAGQE